MSPADVVNAHTLLLEIAALEKVLESLKYARTEHFQVLVSSVSEDRGGTFSMSTHELRVWLNERIGERDSKLRRLGVER